MLDFAVYIGSTPTLYISICILTLPTQHTTFRTLHDAIDRLDIQIPLDLVTSRNDILVENVRLLKACRRSERLCAILVACN